MRENSVPKSADAADLGFSRLISWLCGTKSSTLCGDEERVCGRTWTLTHNICPPQVLVALVSRLQSAISLVLQSISGKLSHGGMNSTCDDSVVAAETATEVESTSGILSEVQSHSQNLQKKLLRCKKSLCGLKRALEVIVGIWWPA